MKLFISFWINYYKIAWYFPPCTIPPCRLVLDINLWVVLVPPKLNFWGTLLTEYLIWFIFFCTLLLDSFYSLILFSSYTLSITIPCRYRTLEGTWLESAWTTILREVRLWPPTLAAPLQCHTHSWCSWPVVQHRGIKSLSETGRATSTPGGTTAAKKPPFQKTWNYSVLIFYFLTEVTVIF